MNYKLKNNIDCKEIPGAADRIFLCVDKIKKNELEILQAILKESDGAVCFDDIWQNVKQLERSERALISQIVIICQLLLVNPSTTASGERSFSAARRLKTWRRTSMTQKRFNNLSLLHIHKLRTDSLNTTAVAINFIEKNDYRKKKLWNIQPTQ